MSDLARYRNVVKENLNLDLLVPEDWHLLRIISTEVKPNRRQTGDVLRIDFAFCSPMYTGLRVIEHINLTNPQKVAVQKSAKLLQSLLDALGLVELPDDNRDLHGLTVVGKVFHHTYWIIGLASRQSRIR